MKLIIPILAIVALSGCVSQERAVQHTVGSYEMDDLTVRVIYENERAFDIVVESLYWYNLAHEGDVSVEDEAFLTTVLPSLNTRVEEGFILITEKEAGRFYRASFLAVSGRDASPVNYIQE